MANRIKTLIAAPVLALSCTVISFAQTSPLVAKLRVIRYQTQNDGSERSMQVKAGNFYRASSGDTMQTRYAVDTDGNKIGPELSQYHKIANGRERIYMINHGLREASARQERAYSPFRPNSDTTYHGHSVSFTRVQGLRCIVMPIEGPDGQVIGHTWRALDIDDLIVKMETRGTNGRQVFELYDIRFAEPSSSRFRIPSGFAVDTTNCRGCE